MIILCVDDDERPVAKFSSAMDAAEYAEREGTFAEAYEDGDGELKSRGDAFWFSRMDTITGEITTGLTAIYKYGSSKRPCRDGFSCVGHAIQDLDTIVAWGATKREAESRVVAQKDEGIRRARRDRVWKNIENEARKTHPEITWDPYGLWIDRIAGLRKRLEKESEAAYNMPI